MRPAFQSAKMCPETLPNISRCVARFVMRLRVSLDSQSSWMLDWLVVLTVITSSWLLLYSIWTPNQKYCAGTVVWCAVVSLMGIFWYRLMFNPEIIKVKLNVSRISCKRVHGLTKPCEQKWSELKRRVWEDNVVLECTFNSLVPNVLVRSKEGVRSRSFVSVHPCSLWNWSLVFSLIVWHNRALHFAVQRSVAS